MFVLFARIRFLEGHKIYQRSGIGTHGIALGFLFDYNKSTKKGGDQIEKSL